tara:strand:+ start:1439 stop:1771 length:333 start_codon:yes stop_codon:yes gene_type:complete
MPSGLVQTMYGADSSDSKKMKPKGVAYQYKKAVAPAANTVVDAPLYVIINSGHATKYEFKYESDGGFVDYGVVDATTSSTRIDIQPIAWKGGAGDTGDVTFVYNQSSASN